MSSPSGILQFWFILGRQCPCDQSPNKNVPLDVESLMNALVEKDKDFKPRVVSGTPVTVNHFIQQKNVFPRLSVYPKHKPDSQPYG